MKLAIFRCGYSYGWIRRNYDKKRRAKVQIEGYEAVLNRSKRRQMSYSYNTASNTATMPNASSVASSTAMVSRYLLSSSSLYKYT